ncbi:unnamed protein product [Bemisia tabaci]|uniref:separase n=1 Tax=Bemisia tabaci TaxID=7038 RepID=A0A9P0AG09_BEMTA|nr:unnamed protein product [Bemisia tabaci]
MKKTLEDIDKNVLPNAKFCCAPVNKNLRKLAALECFDKGDIDMGIHHLTESHAIGFRSKIVSRISQVNEMQAEFLSLPHISFDPDLINFSSKYASSNDKGLMERLQELPEEWTLVQLTQGFSSKTRCTPREAGTPSSNSVFHITRFSCGRNARKPCCVTLPKGSITAAKLSSIFEIIEKAVTPVSSKKVTPSKMLREACIPNTRIFSKLQPPSKSTREEYGEALKVLVDEINSEWLQQWRCMLLGQLCASDLKKDIRKTVDKVLSKSKLPENSVTLLYQIMDGSGHLDLGEIEAAVSDCIHDEDTRCAMIEAIKEFKESNLNLAVAKRYPVLLILDEILDKVPWEMIPVLRRHPVSRIFSVHFAHAMYNRFKQQLPMKDGCFIIEKPEDGYYVINPGKDLSKMEEKMCDFISSRVPSWDGIAGSFPPDKEFAAALKNHSFLLYCGHGNGTQYFSSDMIFSLDVKAIPLLFGCSSVKMEDFGGRVCISGLAMKYLTAGSPCVLGMLWKVTSNDADNMCVTLLNNWLPGKSAEIASFISGKVEIVVKSEPELLRSLRFARESCVYYVNSAGLVVYGIPVKFS